MYLQKGVRADFYVAYRWDKKVLPTWLDYANIAIERVSVNDGLVVMIWQIEFPKPRKRESRNL